MYWLFALQPVFMLSMRISEVITKNTRIHGQLQITSGLALTSKAIQPDVSWLRMYIFKDAICGRHRGVFVHITANLVWLLGSRADIWVVFTPRALDEVGILKSAHYSQDDHVFIFQPSVFVWLCLCVCSSPAKLLVLVVNEEVKCYPNEWDQKAVCICYYLPACIELLKTKIRENSSFPPWTKTKADGE